MDATVNGKFRKNRNPSATMRRSNRRRRLWYVVALVRAQQEERLGPSPKGIILFTHLRRCGGTYLEEAVLKPHVRSLGVRPLLCKEGELGRHHRLAPNQKAKFKGPLRDAALVWRHCPYGVHQLLDSRPYMYVTMLRKPAERMVSWFAYCDQYSPDKCKTGRFTAPRDASRLIAFYQTRQAKYQRISHDRRTSLATFHEDWLEFALDDNYAVRMICGGDAHDSEVPLYDDALLCAQTHLRAYTFVGTLELRDLSICLLSHLLGIPSQPGNGGPKRREKLKLRGPTTNTHAVPDAFTTTFASYLRLDNDLFALATDLVLHQATLHSECRHHSPASSSVPAD